MSESIHCAIYRSTVKLEAYLYIQEKDDFSAIPEPLRKSLGRLEFVMELELGPERKLARAAVSEVMESLREKGFFLQMPPPDPLAPYRVVEKRTEGD